MKKSNNFISIISLGSFNPAIFKPSFLDKKCGFKSKTIPTGNSTPIATVLDFGNTSFLVSLERFQIKETEPSDPIKKNILNVMNKCLEVLPYTPVHTMGLNFNIDLEAGNEGEIKRAIGNLEDRSLILKNLIAKEMSITEKTNFSKKSASSFFWKFLKKEKETIINVTIELNGNFFTVNYNYEIQKIAKNNRLLFLNKYFAKIRNDFQRFLKVFPESSKGV